MASEQRRLANQQNAAKSTGPKTAAGKARSRRNALKHGLTGEGVVLSRPDEAKLKVELKELTEHLQPIDVLERILVTGVAVASVRIKKAVKKELAESARSERRALKRWEKRQEAAAAEIATGLESDPVETFEALTASSFGCDWLIGQWDELDGLLVSQDDWTFEQTRQATRLLGLDPDKALLTEPDPCGTLWKFAMALGKAEGESRQRAIATMRAVIAEQQKGLEQRADQLSNEQEAAAREEVTDCAAVDTSDNGVRLQGYENRAELSLHRNLGRLVHHRKIEPETQSVERWHKTGKLQPRRWDGLNYAPTNPYVKVTTPPSAVGGQEMVDGRTAAEGQKPDAGQVPQAVAGCPEKEANVSNGNPAETDTCGDASPGHATASGWAPVLMPPGPNVPMTGSPGVPQPSPGAQTKKKV
ncbi:MAG TPA: hypothetical protein VGZ22_30385 [Isosphaeraceae bacterium]|jgi:hypothetical protein|nr:hypothetical protein [Isosphaeraceae bacterium]